MSRYQKQLVRALLCMAMIIAQYSAFEVRPCVAGQTEKGKQTESSSGVTSSLDGRYWLRSSSAERADVCKSIANKLGGYTWEQYISILSDFYASADDRILNEPIVEVAALLAALPSENEQDANIVGALKNGTITRQEMQVFIYLQKRWDYYASRDGSYKPDVHDRKVYDEACKQFSLSLTEVQQVQDRVDRIRVGLKPPEKVTLDEGGVAVDLSVLAVRALKGGVLSVTIQNKTLKELILPTINLTVDLYLQGKYQGYQVVWVEGLGYGDTKEFVSLPIRYRFDSITANAFINADKMKSLGLKSKIQMTNDPQETIIPVLKTKRINISK